MGESNNYVNFSLYKILVHHILRFVPSNWIFAIGNFKRKYYVVLLLHELQQLWKALYGLPKCQITIFSSLSTQIVCNFSTKIVWNLIHAFLLQYIAIRYAFCIHSFEIHTLCTTNDSFEHAMLVHFDAVCIL